MIPEPLYDAEGHEVYIPFDEWGEVRFPRRAIDLEETEGACEIAADEPWP